MAAFGLFAAVGLTGLAAVPTCSNVRIARVPGASSMGVFFNLDMDAIVTEDGIRFPGI